MTSIALSRLHFPVTTLGPGNRIGIWFQGCSIRCQGCISVDTWKAGVGIIELDRVIEQLVPWLEFADGVTISGGEPFDQLEALTALLAHLRRATKADILVYSGYSINMLSPKLLALEGLIDVLISEPFDPASPQTLALRGSDNQHMTFLTALGRERFGKFSGVAEPNTRALDIMFDEDGSAWMAGIPDRGDLSRLQQLLAIAGTSAKTSEDCSTAAIVRRK